MIKRILFINFFFLSSIIVNAQEEVVAQPSELERLIIDIQAKVDIEKSLESYPWSL